MLQELGSMYGMSKQAGSSDGDMPATALIAPTIMSSLGGGVAFGARENMVSDAWDEVRRLALSKAMRSEGNPHAEDVKNVSKWFLDDYTRRSSNSMKELLAKGAPMESIPESMQYCDVMDKMRNNKVLKATGKGLDKVLGIIARNRRVAVPAITLAGTGAGFGLNELFGLNGN